MLNALKDDKTEAAVFQKEEIEAKILKQKTELEKSVPAHTRLSIAKGTIPKRLRRSR